MEALFRSGINTPFGSIIKQALFTETLVQIAQHLPYGRWKFVEEFTYTFQTATLGHEVGIIKKVYGIIPYIFAAFFANTLYALTFYGNVFANSTSTIHKFAHEKRMPVWELCCHMLVQIAACLLAVRYSRWAWSMDFWNLFSINWDPLADCTSDMRVPVFWGMVVEGGLTFLQRTLIHARNQMPFGIPLCSLAMIGLSLLGNPFTGGYCSPSLAFALQYGCKGHEKWQFFLVYFLAPTIGALLSGELADSIWKRILPNKNWNRYRNIE